MTWEYRVLRGIFDDELGPLARDYVGSPLSWTALERPSSTTRTPVVGRHDDTRPSRPPTARCSARAGRGRRRPAGDARRPADVALGRGSTRRPSAEQTLGTSGIGPLEWYLNHGPVAVAGAAGAVNNTYYRLARGYPDPYDPEFVPVGLDGLFTVTNLPSYRLLIDMGDLDGARIVITTGQSGNPFDAHYDDQIEPWRTGRDAALPVQPRRPSRRRRSRR